MEKMSGAFLKMPEVATDAECRRRLRQDCDFFRTRSRSRSQNFL